MSLPVFSSLGGYRREWLRGDLIAGLTVWAVLVPEALAYATIAGVSPVVGLYAAPPALILYAAFGSSKHLVTGPMAATAALSAAAVADLATGGTKNFAAYTVALALVTGALALGAGLLRLGFLATFISEPVLKGFIVGLALTIIIGQVPKLLGVEKTEGDFFRQLWGLLGNLGETQGVTVVVGLSSLVLVFALRRFAPAVPGSLVVVLLGILAVHVFDLAAHGVDIVGHIDSGLPSVGLPHGLAWSDYGKLVAAGVGVMLVGFAEGLGAAKTYAARDNYDIDPNRELIGLGAANIGAGLSSGMVVNGSLSKTAVNGSAGAHSQVSGLFVALMTVITLLFFTSLFEDLPEATLAAVVIAALVDLVDYRALMALYRLYTSELGKIYGPVTRADFIAAVAAMSGVLVFDTLPGLFIGIAVSILLLLFRASRPHIAELGKVAGTRNQWTDRGRHPENSEVAGIAVLRVEAGLFFANADDVRNTIKSYAARPGVTAIVLDAESIAGIDSTATQMVIDLSVELRRVHCQLAIAHGVGQVRDMLRLADGVKESPLLLFSTVQSAVDSLSARD
ncbi:MAG TPA: SulP family inorganic anion transporter [Acidimicrobiia bacterium]|nr:SulP family inorganic anion transporter [Acidimicrobiia bacterium]